jgi:hypothetical protein
MDRPINPRARSIDAVEEPGPLSGEICIISGECDAGVREAYDKPPLGARQLSSKREVQFELGHEATAPLEGRGHLAAVAGVTLGAYGGEGIGQDVRARQETADKAAQHPTAAPCGAKWIGWTGAE